MLRTIRECWDVIENWQGFRTDAFLKSLLSGISADDLIRLEDRLDCFLPTSFRQSLLIHEGETGETVGLFCCNSLLASDAILQMSQAFIRLLDEAPSWDLPIATYGCVRADYWHPKWIPFTNASGNPFYALDLYPAEGGAVGQVILVDDDSFSRSVVAESYLEWLSRYCDALDGGRIEQPTDDSILYIDGQGVLSLASRFSGGHD